MSRYTDDEAKEILRRALEQDSSNAGRLHHEDLVEAAREVGIPPELVEQAAFEWSEDKEALEIVDRRRRKKKSRYYRGLGVFVIVNAFLVALDMLTTGGTWFFYPLLAWSLLVVLRGYFVLLPPSKERLAEDVGHEKKKLRRIRAREEARRRKEAERERRRNASSDFERAVEGGVSALLGAIARQLEAPAVQPPPARRKSGFEDYVAGRRSGAPARGQRAEPPKRAESTMRKDPIVTPAPRARVEVDDEDEHPVPGSSRRSSHRR